MKQWFDRLSRRDQLLLGPLALLLAAVLLYALIWSPLNSALARYETANAASVDDLVWMRKAADDLRQRGSGLSALQQGQSLSALVDASLSKHKLVLKQFQPVGESAVQLLLEEAPMAQVIAWLAGMEREAGMRLDNVAIVAAEKQGHVKVRVRMSRI